MSELVLSPVNSTPARTDLASGPLQVAQTIEVLKTVQTFIAASMKPDIDFGQIPGTQKPTLLQPGAQKCVMLFNAYPDVSVERNELGNGHVEFVATVTIISRDTGMPIGKGCGSASTMESRYRFRNAEKKCPACGKTTIIKGKAEYGGGWVCFGKKGGCGAKFGDGDPAITGQKDGKVENDNPHDVRNTVLKMANKRALVAAALSLGCLSEVFTQDLEDNVYTPAEVARAAESRHQPEPAREAPSKPAKTVKPLVMPDCGLNEPTPQPEPSESAIAFIGRLASWASDYVGDPVAVTDVSICEGLLIRAVKDFADAAKTWGDKPTEADAETLNRRVSWLAKKDPAWFGETMRTIVLDAVDFLGRAEAEDEDDEWEDGRE